jgi:signal transduction histidine kinase
MNSIAVHQALLSTLVTLAAMIFLAAAAGFAVERSMRADLQRTIDADIDGLTEIMVDGGPVELRRRTADRGEWRPADGAMAYYGIVDSSGARLAGNIGISPGFDAGRSRVAELSLGDDRVLLRATRLRGGWTLLVGRSLRGIEALQRQLWTNFLGVGIAVVLATLVAGFVMAMRLRGRVEVLSQTFTRFERGDRTARSDTVSSDDELGQLTRHVDAHLDWADKLLAAQREISDNIAHELRTPLVHLDTRLLGALGHNEHPAVAAELHLARSNIRSIVSLFDALLDLTLAEAGVTAAETSSFDLSEIAADLAELYTASAEEASLDFKARITPGVTMRGEGMAMTRLIANLLDNAFKYAPSGSKVRLIVVAGPGIIVEDNGVGIAPAEAEHIFLRFRRAAAPDTGHGLGLALVKIIAARHGLAARVEDARPGARFIVEAQGLGTTKEL